MKTQTEKKSFSVHAEIDNGRNVNKKDMSETKITVKNGTEFIRRAKLVIAACPKPLRYEGDGVCLFYEDGLLQIGAGRGNSDVLYVSFPADGQGTFRCSLDKPFFLSALGIIKKGEFSIVVIGDTITFKQKASVSFVVEKWDDWEKYIVNTVKADKGCFFARAETLSSLFKRVSYAIGKDELRPALNGIFMELREDRAIFSTADGHRAHRLTFRDNEVSYRNFKPCKVLFSKGAIQKVAKLCEVNKDANVLAVKKNENIGFRFYVEGIGGVECFMIDERFPDVDKKISSVLEGCSCMKFVTDELLEALVMAKACVESSKTMELHIKGGKVSLCVCDRYNTTEFNYPLVAVVEGVKDMRGGFNVDYMIDAVTAFKRHDYVALRYKIEVKKGLNWIEKGAVLCEEGRDVATNDIALILPVLLLI